MLVALVAGTGLSTPPAPNDSAMADEELLTLPYQPSSGHDCPLLKPIVILKASRSAATNLYDKLLKVLPGCAGYQEISHDDDLMKNGCTAKAFQYQEAVWKDALRKNAIITHNPATQGGGCFSSYYKGASRLTELLTAEDATVLSWTRNNVLRQRYSEFRQAATKDSSGNTSTAIGSDIVKWGAPGREIVQEVINGACEMLAIQSAAKRCTSHQHRHVVYEDYAKDPMAAVEQVLQWAELKEGVNVKEVLEPYRDSLQRKSDELAFAGSFAYAFERPDDVFKSLQAVCLDWTFWGGSFTDTHTPRPMCLSAPSCERAGLGCSCAKPEIVHNARNAVWLGSNQSQPNWWLDMPRFNSHVVDATHNKLVSPLQPVPGPEKQAETGSSPEPSATFAIGGVAWEGARQGKVSAAAEHETPSPSPEMTKDQGVLQRQEERVEAEEQQTDADFNQREPGADAYMKQEVVKTVSATSLARPMPPLTETTSREAQQAKFTTTFARPTQPLAAREVQQAGTKQQDAVTSVQRQLQPQPGFDATTAEPPRPPQHGWIWKDGHYVWQEGLKSRRR